MSLEMTFLRCFLAAACATAVSSVILEVPGYATIRGKQNISAYNHRQYFSFHNLPYAQQPTNLTRFLVKFCNFNGIYINWLIISTYLLASCPSGTVSNKWNTRWCFTPFRMFAKSWFNCHWKWKLLGCRRTFPQSKSNNKTTASKLNDWKSNLYASFLLMLPIPVRNTIRFFPLCTGSMEVYFQWAAI